MIYAHHGDRRQPTLTEIREWPAAVSLTDAARALGISRSCAYEAAQVGEFPARVIRVMGRRVVVTADLLRLLGGSDAA